MSGLLLRPAPRSVVWSAGSGRARSEMRSITHRGVARSLEILRNRWHEPIEVGDLVEVSALSRRGFIKAFARYTGTTPKVELSRLRLRHARRLLQQTDWPMSRIAARCGYQSANSFLVAFKRENGLTLRQYRNQ